MDVKINIPQHQIRKTSDAAGDIIEFDVLFPDVFDEFRRVKVDYPLTKEKILTAIKVQYLEAVAKAENKTAAINDMNAFGFSENTIARIE